MEKSPNVGMGSFCNVQSILPADTSGLVAAARTLQNNPLAREPLILRGWARHSQLLHLLTMHGDLELPVHTRSRNRPSEKETASFTLETRDLLQCLRNGSVPRGSYSFTSVHGASDEGGPLESVVQRLASTSGSCGWLAPPDVYLSVGGPSSGLAFHAHGPALNVLLSGRKRWFLSYDRTAEGIPYDELLDSHGYGPMGLDSMSGWLSSYLQVGENEPHWRRHAWDCTQEAGDVIILPGGLAHGVVNLGAVGTDHDANHTLAVALTAVGELASSSLPLPSPTHQPLAPPSDVRLNAKS